MKTTSADTETIKRLFKPGILYQYVWGPSNNLRHNVSLLLSRDKEWRTAVYREGDLEVLSLNENGTISSGVVVPSQIEGIYVNGRYIKHRGCFLNFMT